MSVFRKTKKSEESNEERTLENNLEKESGQSSAKIRTLIV